MQRELQKMNERLKESSTSGSTKSAVDHILALGSMEEVVLGETISQGGFAVVQRARWLEIDCACKRIVDPRVTNELREDFETEVTMLACLRHPRILTILAVCRQPPHLAVLTELVDGGTLYEYLHKRRANGSTEAADAERPEVQRIALETAEGFTYLHFMSIVHRDIKSQNVLLTPVTRGVKICDFGLARRKSDLCTGRMQFAGTPSYMAPELFKKQSYSEKVDVFAFGALLSEIFMLQVPFDGLEGPDIAAKWDEGYVPRISNALPRGLRALISSAWNPDPSVRPAMADVAAQLRSINWSE
jgi:serine/threonine protein kinase